MTRAADLAELGSAYAGAVPFSLRNKIINGDFRFWQRGTSIAVGSGLAAYAADRWRCANSTGQTCAVSRVAASVGNEYAGQAYLSASWTAGAGGHFIGQRIEDVRQFSGKTITISFYAADSVASQMNVVARQCFGTGGTPSVDVDTFQTIAVGTTYAATGAANGMTSNGGRVNVTLTLPSINGKTMGTNGDDYLEIIFSQTPTSAHTFTLGAVQVEVGHESTPFEQRPVGLELMLCQRYFERVMAIGTTPLQSAHGYAISATQADFQIAGSGTPKRKIPAASFSAGSTFSVTVNGSLITATAIAAVNYAANQVTARATVAGSLTAGQGSFLYGATGQTATVDLDAEL